jgi:hypothetical protein
MLGRKPYGVVPVIAGQPDEVVEDYAFWYSPLVFRVTACFSFIGNSLGYPPFFWWMIDLGYFFNGSPQLILTLSS